MAVFIATLLSGAILAAQEAEPTDTSPAALLAAPTDERPVVVRASFHLQDINEIDDEAESFQFTGVLILIWRDTRQSFEPSEEHVEEKVYQGSYQFNELAPAWYPQVVLANESGMYEKHGTVLRVRPDGTCTLVETVNAIAEADLDMRRFPFDTQRLDLVFEILGFDRTEVVLEPTTLPEGRSPRDIKVSQWEFEGLGVSSGELSSPYAGRRAVSSTFVVSLDVSRKSFFMLRLVVVPLVLIVMLSWSVFWMDRSSLGDRINVSFIGLLTAVAYQNVVSDILPSISYVTLMNAMVNFSFFIMCASVMMNLVVGELDKRGMTHAGNLVDYRSRIIFPLVYFGLLLLSVIVAFVFF